MKSEEKKQPAISIVNHASALSSVSTVYDEQKKYPKSLYKNRYLNELLQINRFEGTSSPTVSEYLATNGSEIGNVYPQEIFAPLKADTTHLESDSFEIQTLDETQLSRIRPFSCLQKHKPPKSLYKNRYGGDSSTRKKTSIRIKNNQIGIDYESAVDVDDVDSRMNVRKAINPNSDKVSVHTNNTSASGKIIQERMKPLTDTTDVIKTRGRIDPFASGSSTLLIETGKPGSESEPSTESPSTSSYSSTPNTHENSSNKPFMKKMPQPRKKLNPDPDNLALVDLDGKENVGQLINTELDQMPRVKETSFDSITAKIAPSKGEKAEPEPKKAKKTNDADVEDVSDLSLSIGKIPPPAKKDPNKNQTDAKKNQTDPNKNQTESKHNQIDPNKNQTDASKNQTDANKNQTDAKKNQTDAKKNQTDTKLKENENTPVENVTGAKTKQPSTVGGDKPTSQLTDVNHVDAQVDSTEVKNTQTTKKSVEPAAKVDASTKEPDKKLDAKSNKTAETTVVALSIEDNSPSSSPSEKSKTEAKQKSDVVKQPENVQKNAKKVDPTGEKVSEKPPPAKVDQIANQKNKLQTQEKAKEQTQLDNNKTDTANLINPTVVKSDEKVKSEKKKLLERDEVKKNVKEKKKKKIEQVAVVETAAVKAERKAKKRKQMEQKLIDDYPIRFATIYLVLLLILSLAKIALQMVLSLNKAPLSTFASGLWSSAVGYLICCVVFVTAYKRHYRAYKISLVIIIIGILLFIASAIINSVSLSYYKSSSSSSSSSSTQSYNSSMLGVNVTLMICETVSYAFSVVFLAYNLYIVR